MSVALQPNTETAVADVSTYSLRFLKSGDYIPQETEIANSEIKVPQVSVSVKNKQSIFKKIFMTKIKDNPEKLAKLKEALYGE